MKGKKQKKHQFQKVPIWMMTIVSVISMLSLSVFAENGDQWKDFYERNSKILETNNLIASTIRWLGWQIIKGLADLTKTVQKLYDKSFGFIDMTTNSTVNEFVQRFKPAFIALTALALLYLGYILIMKHDKKPNLASNICIAILCVSCSTFMFSTLNSLASSFKAGVDSYSYKGNTNAAVTIIDENMIDVLQLYKKHGASLKPSDYKKTTAGITDKNLDYFKINSVINYSSDDFDTEENPFKYRLDADSPNGSKRTIENDNGWGINDGNDADFGNEFYYRYNFEWLNAFVQLIAVIIVYIAMSYKCVRVAFELVVARLIAYLYSAELSGGEKIRKILAFIRDSYILLGITAICIKLYAVFTGFIHSYVGASLTAAIFSLFLAFSVIDGPNLVEKLLGMDAGLKSSTARMMALGGMVIGASKATTRTASNIINKFHQKTKDANFTEAAATNAARDTGQEKAKDTMDKGNAEKFSDKSGQQDSDFSKNNSNSSGNHERDFMERGNSVNDRTSYTDPGMKMDKKMGNSGESLFNRMGKSDSGTNGKSSSSMPKRSTGTKSKYTSRKGKK